MKINLMSATPMLTKVLGFIKEFGILIAIGLALYFGYQGIFGESGLKKFMEKESVRSEERAKLQELQDKQSKEELTAAMTGLTDSVNVLESFRQRVGSTIKGYHTDMKAIEAANEVDV